MISENLFMILRKKITFRTNSILLKIWQVKNGSAPFYDKIHQFFRDHLSPLLWTEQWSSINLLYPSFLAMLRKLFMSAILVDLAFT